MRCQRKRRPVLVQNVPQRYRHVPNMRFMMKPTTRPICMRRLNTSSLASISIRTRGKDGEKTHEKTVLSGVSRACPLSQNAAGLGTLRKKKGRRGKKKPMMMPLSTARARESLSGDALPEAPPLPRASIHCSSSARACSSSVLPGHQDTEKREGTRISGGETYILRLSGIRQ
jgi:hypothetical protein